MDGNVDNVFPTLLSYIMDNPESKDVNSIKDGISEFTWCVAPWPSLALPAWWSPLPTLL